MPVVENVRNAQYAQILVFAFLCAIIFFLIKPLNIQLKIRLSSLQEALIDEAETFLRRDISYDSIGASLFSIIDIKNLTIRGDSSSPLLSISRLKIHWSIGAFLKFLFEKNFDAMYRAVGDVIIDNPSVNLDVDRDKDILDILASLQDGKALDLAESVPLKIRIRNGTAFITAENGGWKSLILTDIGLEASVINHKIAFKTKADAGVALNDASCSISTVIYGTSSMDFKNVNAKISLLSFSSDFFTLKTAPSTITALSFNMNVSNENITAFTASNPLPFDLSLEYQPQSKGLSLTFSAEDFTPADFITFSGDMQKFQQYMGVSLSGSANLDVKPDRVQYAASLTGGLPSDFLIGKADFVVNGWGDEKSATLNEITLKTPKGVFGFYGSVVFSPFALNGKVSVSNFTIDRYKKANASLIATANTKNASLRGESVFLDKIILQNPEIQVFFGNRGVDWSLSVEDVFFEGEEVVIDESGSSQEAFSQKRIEADGAFDYNPRQMDARLVLNDVALSKLFGVAQSVASTPELPLMAENILSNAVVRTEAFFSTDFRHFLYSVPNFDLTYHNVEKDERIILKGSLSGTDKWFDLNEGRIAWKGGNIDGNLFANFSGQNDISFGSSFSYLQNNYTIQGSILDRNSISIQGSYGINAFLMIENGLSGYIEAVNVPFFFQGRNAALNVKASMQYETKDSWFADVDNFEIINLWTPISPSNTVRFSARADQNGVLFTSIFWNDGVNALNGNFSLNYADSFSKIDGALSLSDESRKETYQLDFSCADALSENRSLDAHLQGMGMRLERFTSNAYGAVVSGQMDIDWKDIENFSMRTELSSVSAIVNDVGVRLKCSMDINNDSAEIRGVEAHYGSLNVSIPLVQASLDGKHAETAAVVDGTSLGRVVELAFTLTVDFDAAVDSWLDAARIADSLKGSLTIDKARFDALRTTAPFGFEFSRTDETLRVTGGPNDMLRLNITDSGGFYAGLSAPFPIRGSITGVIDSKNIDTACRDLYIDLAALWKLIPPQKDIAVVGGFINADIEIRGPLASPEFFGQAIGNSVRLQIPTYLKHDVRPVPMTVTLNGTDMSFGPVPASVGAGYGTVSGMFHFDRWAPDTFTINISVEEANAIPFGFDIMGVIASGDVFGSLILSQSDGVFHVGGDLTAQDSEITLNSEELEAAQNQSMDVDFPSTVNLMVRTGSKVEFLWPTAAFPLIRAYADQGVSLDIQHDTTTGRFALVGDVRLRSGEIFYFERSFYLREGLLSFNENETRFEPHISARAEARDRSDEGAVTISMIIDNAPLWSFNPRFESNPPLSQIAIFELLGQTMMSGVEEGGGSGRMAGLSSLTDLVAQTQGVRQAERRIRNWLRLDMFSLRTQFVQNLLFQSSMFQQWVQDREQSGQEQIESSTRPGNLFDNTTVFIGKYLTKDLFFQVMLSLRYEKSNPDFGGLTLEPDFGLELRNPFFDMRWSLVPLHPENLFVNDMAFTLLWRKNF
ncbi:MAG: translocation/assembly module TamB domain-containing protein [Treponema sp.]|jgi:hypothetical protein|nr:translocation/assembly module TamB domain-containing protein [Treponema sp.]